MIAPAHPRLSIVRQCALVSISRSSFYYAPAPADEATLALMREIDEAFLDMPWCGSRQMTRHLRRLGHILRRKRVCRLMRLMGLVPIYRKPKTSDPNPQHRICPYLLRGLTVDRPDHVWCADVTYIPMRRGFLYLVAVMDRASRKVLARPGLARRLSNTLDARFCVAALEEAIARYGGPGDIQHGSVESRLRFICKRPPSEIRQTTNTRNGPLSPCHLTLSTDNSVRMRGLRWISR